MNSTLVMNEVSAPVSSLSSPRNILFWIMALSTLWEAAITLSLLLYPEFEASQYHGQLNEQVVFLGNIIGGFMILFTALCALCSYQVRTHNPNGKVLAGLIGIFWIYMGVGLYFHPGAPTYVLLDTVRGAVIAVLALLLNREETEQFTLS